MAWKLAPSDSVTKIPPEPAVAVTDPEVVWIRAAAVPTPLVRVVGAVSTTDPAPVSSEPPAREIEPPVVLPPVFVATVMAPPDPVVMPPSAAAPVPPPPAFTLIATAPAEASAVAMVLAAPMLKLWFPTRPCSPRW